MANGGQIDRKKDTDRQTETGTERDWDRQRQRGLKLLMRQVRWYAVKE